MHGLFLIACGTLHKNGSGVGVSLICDLWSGFLFVLFLVGSFFLFPHAAVPPATTQTIPSEGLAPGAAPLNSHCHRYNTKINVGQV